MKAQFTLTMALLAIALHGFAQDKQIGKDKRPDKVSFFSGIGTPFRFSIKESKLNLPLLMTYERNIPNNFLSNAFYAGGYARYAHFTNTEFAFPDANWSMLGIGGRASFDIVQAANNHREKINRPKSQTWFRCYAGIQFGVDFIFHPDDRKIEIDNSSVESTNQDFRFDIFIGLGGQVSEKISLQIELGRTSPAVLTIGASYKLSKLKNSASL